MIDKNNQYFKQAVLVGTVLPQIDKHDCFALKGGTAINLFVQDMPRLSVDIDLTYLFVEERDKSLRNIGEALEEIKRDIEKYVVGAKVTQNKSKLPSKLVVSREGAAIKIEPNLVIRGTAFPSQEREFTARAQEVLEMSAKMRIVSLPDLYGGKICAALDRQHPRDLYDIKFLLDKEGITGHIRKGFLVYLISHDRPIHESLSPVMKDVRDIYETDFLDMTEKEVSYDELVQVRSNLLKLIKEQLTQDEKDFLISFKEGKPKWKLLGVDGVENLPAIKWKLFNIGKMNEDKKKESLEKLRSALQ